MIMYREMNFSEWCEFVLRLHRKAGKGKDDHNKARQMLRNYLVRQKMALRFDPRMVAQMPFRGIDDKLQFKLKFNNSDGNLVIAEYLEECGWALL